MPQNECQGFRVRTGNNRAARSVSVEHSAPCPSIVRRSRSAGRTSTNPRSFMPSFLDGATAAPNRASGSPAGWFVLAVPKTPPVPSSERRRSPDETKLDGNQPRSARPAVTDAARARNIRRQDQTRHALITSYTQTKRALKTSATQRPQRPSVTFQALTPETSRIRSLYSSSSGSSPSASRSGEPARICSAIRPEFWRIAVSILAAMSGLALRNAFEFSRPWPSRWLS